MNKDTLLLLILAILLLAGMIFTLFAGGERSRHGYGLNYPEMYRMKHVSS